MFDKNGQLISNDTPAAVQSPKNVNVDPNFDKEERVLTVE